MVMLGNVAHQLIHSRCCTRLWQHSRHRRAYSSCQSKQPSSHTHTDTDIHNCNGQF